MSSGPAKKNIALLPGDGIGPEVLAEVEALLPVVSDAFGCRFRLSSHLIGGAAIDAAGEPLPAATLDACLAADAVLLGAVGGPKWSDPAAEKRPEQGLLGLRKALNVYMNLRPVRAHPALAGSSPLKPDRLEGVDFMVVRELTGGIYFGDKQEGDDYASDLCCYSRAEIERVVIRAAVMARQRGGRLTLVDKANVMATSRLWRKVFGQVMQEQFPDVPRETMLVDAAAMRLVADPAHFDVLVTENMFGDILTDEASVLSGSMGMLPSASLGDDGPGLFEPIHGSAPDIAGRGVANPFGAIASLAMALRYGLDLPEAAASIDAALADCVAVGACTADIGGAMTTAQAGQAVRERLAGRRRQTRAGDVRAN